MRWLVADTLYNAESRWCGHLESYSLYLAEAGEDIVPRDLREEIIGGRDFDVLFALDRWADFSTHRARLRVAQINADLRPYPWECGGYGLIMSAIPWMVEAARAAGCNAHLVPLAFDSRARVAMMGAERVHDLIQLGSMTNAHTKRARIVAELGDRLTTLPPAFGRDYFRALASAHAVLNIHADWSRGAMMNMRLHEALGMGCDVISDGRPPEWLADFEVDCDIRGAARFSGLAAAHVLERETYVERIPQILQLVKEAMP